jgi:hypothetical protein
MEIGPVGVHAIKVVARSFGTRSHEFQSRDSTSTPDFVWNFEQGEVKIIDSGKSCYLHVRDQHILALMAEVDFGRTANVPKDMSRSQ